MTAPYFDGTQLCMSVGSDAWFPEMGRLTAENRQAIQICKQCHFLEPCREYALAQDAPGHGIWGGTTANERVKIRQNEGKVA